MGTIVATVCNAVLIILSCNYALKKHSTGNRFVQKSHLSYTMCGTISLFDKLRGSVCLVNCFPLLVKLSSSIIDYGYFETAGTTNDWHWSLVWSVCHWPAVQDGRVVLSAELCSYCMIHDNCSNNPTHEIRIMKSIIQMLTVIFASPQKRPLSLCLYVHFLRVWEIPKVRASFIILCYWYLFLLNLSPKQLCLYLTAINEGWFCASICNLLTYFQFGHSRMWMFRAYMYTLLYGSYEN